MIAAFADKIKRYYELEKVRADGADSWEQKKWMASADGDAIRRF